MIIIKNTFVKLKKSYIYAFINFKLLFILFLFQIIFTIFIFIINFNLLGLYIKHFF